MIACAAATAEAFAPGAASLRTSAAPRAAIARGPMMQQKSAGTTTKLTKLTPALFTQLDKDRNGTIDLEELRQVRVHVQRSRLRGHPRPRSTWRCGAPLPRIFWPRPLENFPGSGIPKKSNSPTFASR